MRDLLLVPSTPPAQYKLYNPSYKPLVDARPTSSIHEYNPQTPNPKLLNPKPQTLNPNPGLAEAMKGRGEAEGE